MEQSHGKTNAKENDNLESGNIREGEELKKTEDIPGTPFRAIWNEQNGWWGVCGKYRITETFETKDELIEHVNKKPWDIILAVVNIAMIEGKKLTEEIENVNN